VPLSIAIAGKGGVGKTTVAALLVRGLVESGTKPVLAVDADPNSCLAEALGAEPGRTLAEIREKGSSAEGSPPGGGGRARALRDEIARSVVEAEGFDLVTMGRPEGPRCYCYANTLLRQALDELSRGYAAVVIDNEAGMEHLSRRTTSDVQWLVVVTDPTLPALRAARRIIELSRELPVKIKRRAIVANRTPPGGPGGVFEKEVGELLASHGIERLPDIPQDDALERAGAEGRDVLGLAGDAPAVAAVARALELLRAKAAVGRRS